MKTLSGPTNDLLHKYPDLYEKVFNVSTAPTCLDLYKEITGELPRSSLDFGSGPGRELADMADLGIDSVGVDFVPTMVAYAQRNYPKARFIEGDMRSVRLDCRFDLITCLGACINYMLSNSDLEKALATFKAHCHEKTIVIIEPYNTSSFVGSSTPPAEYIIPDGKLRAIGKASYDWSQTEQIIRRVRRWEFDDGSDAIEDTYTQRLYFSQELSYFLENNGFEIIGLSERQQSKVYNKSLFVLARPVV